MPEGRPVFPERYPDVSIVINTLDREDQLRSALSSLRWLRYPGRFEVVVIDGPSKDGTQELLAGWGGDVKVGRAPVANLSVSRNAGIRLSAGEVVVFLDDDAVPEPDWLTELVAPYRTAGVGASGGFVLDHTGHEYQYRYALLDRFGGASFDVDGPTPERCYPGSWAIPHMLGTNSSYLRSALVEVGGYDEFFEYYLDESDVQLRIADAGYVIARPAGARVHHHFAASHLRSTRRAVHNWYPILKNKLYFGLKHARDYVSVEQVMAEFGQFVAGRRQEVRWTVENGLLDESALARFEADLERATEDGLRGGLAGDAARADLATGPGPFVPFPTHEVADLRRMVLVTSEYPPEGVGGIATYTQVLAAGFAARGHEPHVVTISRDITRVDWEDGVWVHRVALDLDAATADPARGAVPVGPWAWSAACRDEVLRIAETGPVDVVDVPIWDSQGLALAREDRFPLVLTLETSLALWLRSHPERADDPQFVADFVEPMLAAELEMLRSADVVRAISGAILTDVTAAHDVAPAAAVVAPLGIAEPADAARVNPHAARVSRAEGTVNLLFVGRVEPRKGVDVLLEAFALAHERAPHLRLNIVGDDTIAWADGGTLRSAFESEHAGRPHAAAVRFLGLVSDDQLALAYDASDVFVAPSRYESFGLVLVEAMMRGLPVVSTRVGGVPEVVDDGRDGYLVPPDDPGALADALVELGSDPGLRSRMGRHGRAHYERAYTVDAVVEASLGVYGKAAVLRDGGVPR
ncbi:glycosyltransferase [Cellulomonas sp. Y8]|uniref:glycosyltransferase n=1 Tax=Cellulomonas sp. Y8 TaxID=2591145 RepID=UPI0011C76794|nr:glycosyltransferase [Cellulomonas sp. Y8]